MASAAPLVFWILCHLECPDISLVPFSEFIKKRWYYITSPCPLQPLDGDSLPHRGPGRKISGELTKYGIPFGLCVGAHIMRPPVLHRLSLFCQGRRDTTVGSARPLDPPTAAAQTGGLGVVHHPRRTRAPCPRARVSHIGGPEESGLRDSGGTHVEPWSRRERHPAALCRRGQSKPPRRAESLGGGDGGMEGRPLIRHGIRRDTFPPVGGRLYVGPPHIL